SLCGDNPNSHFREHAENRRLWPCLSRRGTLAGAAMPSMPADPTAAQSEAVCQYVRARMADLPDEAEREEIHPTLADLPRLSDLNRAARQSGAPLSPRPDSLHTKADTACARRARTRVSLDDA